MFWGHASPNYRHATIKWFLIREKGSSGSATINLETMQITTNGKDMPLDAKNLARLFGIAAATEHDIVVFGTLVEFLRASRDGGLPPPNHHGHSLPEPLPGYMQHLATGFSLRPLELAWIAGWSGLGILGLVIANSIRHRETDQA